MSSLVITIRPSEEGDIVITTIEDWTTVAVTALPPGWRNVFRQDNGVSTSPCPALLLQELRSVTQSYDPPGERRHRTRKQDPPYETRVVFADFGYGDSDLEAVSAVSNYIGTVGPDSDPAALVPHTAA